jgi:pimeloyl-ACP methyl ester carboxylesterase
LLLLTLMSTLLLLLQAASPSSSPKIFIAGHSLGGALASVAALKLHTSAAFTGMVGGVWTYGSPRVGNAGWKDSYHNYLLPATLRMQGQFDWASTLPAQVQVCLPTTGGTGASFTFGHVGRSVLLCTSSVLEGLQRARPSPTGTEGRCNTLDPTQFDSHLMSHYFDGWLRAWYDLNKSFAIANHPIMLALRCRDCVSPPGRAILGLPDNLPIRGTALVTCATPGSCVRRNSWQAVTMLRTTPLVPYSPLRLCDLTFKCVP